MNITFEQDLAWRTNATWIWMDDRARIILEGKDRVRFLNGMVSSDVSLLKPGQGQLAIKATQKGMVDAILRVRANEEKIFIDVSKAKTEQVQEDFERLIITDDCTFTNIEPFCEVTLLGKRVPELLEEMGIDIYGVSPQGFIEKYGVHFICDSRFLMPCWILQGEKTKLEKWSEREGLFKAPREWFDVVRIEAGIPDDLHDADASTLPMEVGLNEALNFKKGCYVGQETIARATHRGGVHYTWMGVKLSDKPREKAQFYANTNIDNLAENKSTELKLTQLKLSEAKIIGQLKSFGFSPRLGTWIGLARVRKNFVELGAQKLISEGENQVIFAELFSLPFV